MYIKLNLLQTFPASTPGSESYFPTLKIIILMHLEYNLSDLFVRIYVYRHEHIDMSLFCEKLYYNITYVFSGAEPSTGQPFK